MLHLEPIVTGEAQCRNTASWILHAPYGIAIRSPVTSASAQRPQLLLTAALAPSKHWSPVEYDGIACLPARLTAATFLVAVLGGALN